MASLHNLKSEFFRYVTRYITLTREESIKHLKSQEKKFVQQAKGLGTMVLDKLRGSEAMILIHKVSKTLPILLLFMKM